MSYTLLYEELENDSSLKQMVKEIFGEVASTIKAFARERNVTYNDFDGLIGFIQLEKSRDMERAVLVTPARDENRQLGVVLDPVVMRAINSYAHQPRFKLESYFTLPNPESIKDALEKTYQTVMAVRPEDVTVIIEPYMYRLGQLSPV
ncbi:MAG: hypothetical protein HYS80_01150 [Candidatus Aenigmarchaeota archaeon]|nr:hypothetical protein [Candidatus Aenigmarchaeota archaeon]